MILNFIFELFYRMKQNNCLLIALIKYTIVYLINAYYNHFINIITVLEIELLNFFSIIFI